MKKILKSLSKTTYFFVITFVALAAISFAGNLNDDPLEDAGFDVNVPTGGDVWEIKYVDGIVEAVRELESLFIWDGTKNFLQVNAEKLIMKKTESATTNEIEINGKDGTIETTGIIRAQTPSKMDPGDSVITKDYLDSQQWRLVASSKEYTEEVFHTIDSSGITSRVYKAHTGRINPGFFYWPSGEVHEIMFRVEDPHENWWCVGGEGISRIKDSQPSLTKPKCTFFGYDDSSGTTFDAKPRGQLGTYENWARLWINGKKQIYCPDDLKRVRPASNPGGGFTSKEMAQCHYVRDEGSVYGGSSYDYYTGLTDWDDSLSSLYVETADWSSDGGWWSWEIWVR